jgi:hypothetical protein
MVPPPPAWANAVVMVRREMKRYAKERRMSHHLVRDPEEARIRVNNTAHRSAKQPRTRAGAE